MIKLMPSEILKKFETIKDKNEKIKFLRSNQTIPFGAILRALFDPRIEFYTNKIPDYRLDPSPEGMSGNNMFLTARMLYVWYDSHPATPKKKDLILIQHLESLSPLEAMLLENVITKQPTEYKGLSEQIVLEAFPDLYTAPELTQFLRVPNTPLSFVTKQVAKPTLPAKPKVEEVKPIIPFQKPTKKNKALSKSKA